MVSSSRERMLAEAHAREMDDHHRDAVYDGEVQDLREEDIDRPYVRVANGDGTVFCILETEMDHVEPECDPYFYGGGVPRVSIEELIGNAFTGTFVPNRDSGEESLAPIQRMGLAYAGDWSASPFEGDAVRNIFGLEGPDV